MTRKSTLSPESAAVIRHLKEHGTSTAVQLLARAQFAGVNRTQLLKRLGNLVALGWIDFTWDDAGDKTWFIRASARAIAAHVSHPAKPCQPEPVPPVALPRRVYVMQGCYVPPRGPALRAGALDHRAVASRGFRC
jgi:hypothetical protein